MPQLLVDIELRPSGIAFGKFEAAALSNCVGSAVNQKLTMYQPFAGLSSPGTHCELTRH